MDCSPPASSVHGNSASKNTRVGCHALLQGIFPTQVAPALQADSLPSEPPGKPKNTGVASLSLPQGSFRPRNWTEVSCIAVRFFTSQATREAPQTSLHHLKNKKAILLSLDFIKPLLEPHEPHIHTSHYSHTHSPDTLSQYTPTASTEYILLLYKRYSTEAIV